ncbi:MAG: hypothetical protein BGO90_06485 [Legionella sp. 40-6]|nr:2OG-Fe(II) oxygenase [Legionella sp.]OJY47787.1 MAG: hypothetical protein BGO90_06485 [Legionella sp. 40-6]
MLSGAELLAQALSEQGFFIMDNFLPSDYCKELRAYAQKIYAQGAFHSSRIGLQQTLQNKQEIRSDRIFWLDKEQTTNEAVDYFLKKIHHIQNDLNRLLFLSLHEYEVHFAYYSPGSYYKRHIDQFAQKKTRKISLVYYLNPCWQPEFGGTLDLYINSSAITVNPIENRLICFNSELPHEVQVTHQERYSITGWLKTRSAEVLEI